MSASFYDLLKYAKTGIASPGMTAYDKMRAVAMAGGGAIKTLTSVPPLTFKANGKPLISWSMLGNSQQNGIPAPDAPIMPELVGDRTINLYDDTSTVTLPSGVRYGMGFPSGTYSIRNDTDNIVYDFMNSGTSRRELCQPHSTATITFLDEWGECGFFMPYNDASLGGVTIVSGSTPPDHYIPYGFQIPITCAGQTTPIYLGEVPTVRRIKKLVLTGEEDGWNTYTVGSNRFFYVTIYGSLPEYMPIFSNCFSPSNQPGASRPDNSIRQAVNGTNGTLNIRCDTYDTLTSFKQWLSGQYSAGTPVTVWYVLETPETGIVNEPLAKIGTYADTLHSTDAGVSIPTTRGQNTLTVDTDLQPSSMTITYR